MKKKFSVFYFYLTALLPLENLSVAIADPTAFPSQSYQQEPAYNSSPEKICITAAAYYNFLNQNAASDPNHLYDEVIGTDSHTACILQFGTPRNFHYEVIAARENFPVRFLNPCMLKK